MSYRWAVAGELAGPVAVLSEAQLIGHGYRIRFEEVLHEPASVEAEGAIFLQEYRLHRARLRVHAFHPLWPGLALKDRDGRLAGLCFEQYCRLWPSVRGRGIGPELMAEFYVAHPGVLDGRAAAMQRLSWSEAGEACARAAYRLLVSRGAVLAPGQAAVVTSEPCETPAETPSWP